MIRSILKRRRLGGDLWGWHGESNIDVLFATGSGESGQL